MVGGGAMGSAAAYQLARAGSPVLLLEQFPIGHERGASHGHSRIIRLSYEQPTYVRLSQEAYRLWAELELDAGEKLLVKTGMVDLGKRGHPAFESCIASMQEVGIDHQILTGRELAGRYPQFQLGQELVAVLQADAGILNPGYLVPLMARMAAGHGAAVVDNAPVRSIRLDDRGAGVETDRGRYRCQKLILSVGPWAGPVLQGIGLSLPLVVTQEQYAFFKPAKPENYQPGRFPIFAYYGDTPHGPDLEFYGFPIYGLPGVKIARHHRGPVTTADSRSFEADPAVLIDLRGYLESFLPDAWGEVIHAKTCLYTNTPDRHFIIDQMPGYPHVVIAAGFSGHGFKFAILVGKIVAELARSGRTDYPIDLFSLTRFRQR